MNSTALRRLLADGDAPRQPSDHGQPDLAFAHDHAAVEAHGRLIAYLHGGSFIGEMAFVSGNPASATMKAETSLRAFVFDMEKLRSLIGKDDLLSMALHRVVGRDLAQKLEQA